MNGVIDCIAVFFHPTPILKDEVPDRPVFPDILDFAFLYGGEIGYSKKRGFNLVSVVFLAIPEVHALGVFDVPVTLECFFERFKDYWKKEMGTVKAYLYRFFPNDYLGEIDLAKDFRQKDGEYKQYFLDEFDLRIFWEIVSEFGLMTAFGRSLERTGSSAGSMNS